MLAAMPASAANGVDDFRILYAEAFSAADTPSPEGARLKADDALLAGLGFDAYGKRFNVVLEHNARVMESAPGPGIAYQGSIAAMPGSWVRLTRTGNAIHGLFWDGSDAYVIEPVAEAREFLVGATPATGSHVIYRLRDTLVDLGAGYCSTLDDAASDPAATGLSTFNALANDLKSQLVLQQAAGATRYLNLSMLGDASFLTRYASVDAARDAILVRLNNVDGIFSGQLGVEIRVTSTTVYDGTTDPFTATTVPGTLLSEVGRVRNNSPTLKANGLTHLLTGRDLDGNTVGIAYINALCSSSFGVGLTESRGRGAVLESLISAHEIGHNFGAVHDGSGECAATAPDQFIMGPQASLTANSFSQCSVGTMTRGANAAACISTLPPADASVVFDAAPAGLAELQSFAWSVVTGNPGGQPTQPVLLTITLPSGITADSATVPGGTCTLATGSVQCSLGTLDAGTTRTTALMLTASGSGTYALTAVVAAANDVNASNNSATASVTVGVVPVASTPAAASAAQGGGGGGGGAFVFLSLALLGVMADLRRRARQ
jgi:hypothetical protein